NGDAPILVVKPRDHARKGMNGVHDAATERSRVKVERGSVDEELQVHQPAQTDAQRGEPAPEHRGVADAHEVRREIGSVIAQERIEVDAANLLLALDDHLEIDGQSPNRLDEGLDCFGVNEDLTLVVDDAA